jgi:hypothetical protein
MVALFNHLIRVLLRILRRAQSFSSTPWHSIQMHRCHDLIFSPVSKYCNSYIWPSALYKKTKLFEAELVVLALSLDRRSHDDLSIVHFLDSLCADHSHAYP